MDIKIYKTVSGWAVSGLLLNMTALAELADAMNEKKLVQVREIKINVGTKQGTILFEINTNNRQPEALKNNVLTFVTNYINKKNERLQM